MPIEYEEGMEKREDIVIYGTCEEHSVVTAQPKRFIGEMEPHWLCGQCGRDLTKVQIVKRVMPCSICGFCDTTEVKMGFFICERCIRVWKLVGNIMGFQSEPTDDQQ